MRPVDFQQHFQKNQRAFSVSCPETNLQIKTSAEKFFQPKIFDSVLFHNLLNQNPAAGRDPGSAAECEFLQPRKHAPLQKNVNTLKSVPASLKIRSDLMTGFDPACGSE